jgi:hypothetical protein
MHISSYQMHNVLNVYSKQLSQHRSGDKIKFTFKKTLADQINLSPEGKRKTTIDKVAKEIVDKIGRLGTSQRKDQSEIDLSLNGQTNEIETHKSVDKEFVFNVIDEVNIKKTTTLSVEDTNFLMKRLEQLAKDMV